MCKPSKNILLLAAAMLSTGTLAQAADWNVSADLRERYQSFDNFNFNKAVNTNSWEIDSRLYLKANGDFGNGISVYVQPQAVLTQNHSNMGVQSLSQADLLQAYLQYAQDAFTVRLGRQQLVYGDQRLLGHLGWKDVARTFDGAKVMFQQDAMKLDVFAVRPADLGKMTPTAAVPQGQSLVTWEDRRLIGFYGTYNLAPKNGIDAYMINWNHNQQALVAKGRNINTYGLRAFGNWEGFDATVEAVFQSGDWATNIKQSASAFAVTAGYSFDAWKTRIGVEYDFSPGDNKADPKKHKAFVFPYHTNHAHYGEMDRFSWANMKDVHFSVKTSPLKELTLQGDVHMLSLDKAQGDWLDVTGGAVLYAGAPTFKQTKAGTEVDVKAIYKIPAVDGLKLVALYGVFNPGAAVAERNAGKSSAARFAYAIAQYGF